MVLVRYQAYFSVLVYNLPMASASDAYTFHPALQKSVGRQTKPSGTLGLARSVKSMDRRKAGCVDEIDSGSISHGVEGFVGQWRQIWLETESTWVLV